jgi:DNA (cytosine-5)-methyltransferase 1
MENTAQIEIRKTSRQILERYWPDTNRGDNVIDTNGSDLGRPDLIVGGFPCQDTSIAAPHRLGLAGKRGILYYEFTRLVDEVLRLTDEADPRWVIIENPVGLLKSHNGADMESVVRGLEDLGYGWAYRVVDGRYLGAPQRRQRVLIVGHRGGDPRPAWQVLADADRGGAGGGLLDTSGSTGRRPTLAAVAEEGSGLTFRKSRRPRSTTDYATWLPDDYANTLTGFDAGNRQTNIVVQNGRPRFLTLVEWERLMGFPDGWTAGLSDSARYAALGDAMMVNMADWLGRRLLTVHTSIPMIGATP